MPAQSTTRARRTERSRTSRSKLRDELLASHLGLVHHVARQYARRFGAAADLEELISSGTSGLLQAAESFEPARGHSFSTHAVPRIRGAILDDLRRADELPRNVRRRARQLARAGDVLAQRLGRAAGHDELAMVMRVPAATIRRWELEAHGAAPCSLDQAHRPREEPGVTLAEALPDHRVPDVDAAITHEQEVARLRAAIATLREQERTVLALNFFEELKLQDIAQVLQLSVCRISQIRTAALAKLRDALSDLRAA